MDDIISYLVGISIVASLVAKVVSKSKKILNEKDADNEVYIPDEVDMGKHEFDPYTIFDKPKKSIVATTPPQPITHKGIDSVEGYSFEQKKPILERKNSIASDNEVVVISSPKQSKIEVEFDLREAVILSAILTPKFEEFEQN